MYLSVQVLQSTNQTLLVNIEIYFRLPKPKTIRNLRQGKCDVVERRQVLELDGLGLNPDLGIVTYLCLPQSLFISPVIAGTSL